MWGSKVSVSVSRRRKSSSLAAILVAGLTVAGAATPAGAVDVFELNLPQPVTAIRQSADGSFVALGAETFKLIGCDTPEGLCLQTTSETGEAQKAPAGALPDGFVATAQTGDIRKAWYGRPTGRYAHGVLGDAIEGGSLVVVTDNGRKREFVLPENQVFEDITPRIRDLDGDGSQRGRDHPLVADRRRGGRDLRP